MGKVLKLCMNNSINKYILNPEPVLGKEDGSMSKGPGLMGLRVQERKDRMLITSERAHGGRGYRDRPKCREIWVCDAP